MISPSQKKKNILLIGYNFFPEPTGIGKYSGEMMYWLARHGYECTVLTTYPYYPYWQIQEPYTKKRFSYSTEITHFPGEGSLTVYRCPMYVPKKPSGIKRMMLDFSFMATALGRIFPLVFTHKFDFILTVAPSFQFGLLGVLYKKLRGGTTMYHVQDMQIEAARDLRMIKSERIINALFKVEQFIFDQSDYLSSISPEMNRRIAAKAGRPVRLFPNWADTNLFFPVADKARLKQAFGFAPTDTIVLYSGAIGEKQGLESILYAAQEFIDQPSVRFLICGSGPYKANLQQLAQTLYLTNVDFWALQPLDTFNDFLNLADIHLVIQKAQASDLVLPSKLTTILSVGGLALITANIGSGLHALVQEHAMGLLVAAENQMALNDGLRQALVTDTSALRRNARTYAERYLSIDTIMQDFTQLVETAQ